MFTDMVGYTALGQRNEALSLTLVEEQRKLIRPILAKHNGREVKTIGDAFLVEFLSAMDAVRCAYDIQRVVREFNLSLAPDKRIHLRIGLHLGEVVESNGDISGDAVNVASRIEPLAEDGGVCITRQVYDHVNNKVDFHLLNLGPKSLKNVVKPVEVLKLLMPWDETATHAPTMLDRKRIAILPFANMSPDAGDSYFADGITEEIISTVSGIGGLRVVSRTSAMGYRNTTKPLKDIGKELEVGSVLEGSFRKVGSKIRVTAQLIDVTNDEHLWAQSYDRELGDVFSVQTDVARQVADALRVKILPGEESRIAKAPTDSPQAHSLYLKGKYYWNRRSREDLLEALRLFTEAIKLDPGYSLAYSGAADCYLVLGNHRYVPFQEAFSRAKEYASKAVELDQSSAEAHASLGQATLSHDREAAAAAREFEKAIELSPSYATAYHWYGISLMRWSHLQGALEKALRAQELDPLSPQIVSFVGFCYVYLGKYDLAERQQFRALELHHDFIPAIANLRYSYLVAGKYTDAEKWTSEYLRVSKDELGTKFFLAAVYALAGREAEARKAMAEAEALPNPTNLDRRYQAIYKVALGDFEGAIRLAELDYDDQADWLGEIAIDPLFEPIRNDSRIQTIMKRVGVSGGLPGAEDI